MNCDLNQIINLNLNNTAALNFLNCNRNNLTSLNLIDTVNLEELHCSYNALTSLILPNNSVLHTINCEGNQLTNIDVTTCPDLEHLYFGVNLITSLDLSNSTNLIQVIGGENLLSLNIKNGVYDQYMETPWHPINYTMDFICIDDIDEEYNRIQTILGSADVVYNSYCSFVPGGVFYSLEGQSKLDMDTNGCDFDDVTFPDLRLSITDGTQAGTIISNDTGVYSIPVLEGTHTIIPLLENPDYFAISPESFTVDFPTNTSPYNQDFCVTPNGIHNDLEIVIIPLEAARPGFDTDYKIIYKNKGNTTLSGTLELNYHDNDGLIDFVSATPSIDSDLANVLNWSYSNLQPFEIREILLTFNLNTPTETPPLDAGDTLDFIAAIFPLTTDETPEDNIFDFKQFVVNSQDPNDKNCLKGETITIEQVGEYVHYLIRFENIGTADAIHIVVKDEIDLRKFDVSTLIPMHASHDFITNIKDGNIVEFIFEDINLPFDDVTNDGYVVFKIKTVETLVLGDVFTNDAEIYFDYNAPIITNDEETTVAENLSVAESTIQDIVKIYPNPVNNFLFVESKNTLESISIYDVNGRQLNTISFVGNKQNTKLNTSSLSEGIYFVKIKTEVGMQTTKIIKN